MKKKHKHTHEETKNKKQEIRHIPYNFIQISVIVGIIQRKKKRRKKCNTRTQHTHN